MIIVLFSLLFLAVFLLTKSYRYIERYYSTVLYVSLMSILYALICTDYGVWRFPIWWIFTDQASALFQAVILFPATTVVFLRYSPSNKWFATLYLLFFVALYVVMEWFMLRRSEIRYGHGWNLGWSTVIDVLMFFMIWLHEKNRKLTWLLSVFIIVLLVSWFDIPLLVL